MYMYMYVESKRVFIISNSRPSYPNLNSYACICCVFIAYVYLLRRLYSAASLVVVT